MMTLTGGDEDKTYVAVRLSLSQPAKSQFLRPTATRRIVFPAALWSMGNRPSVAYTHKVSPWMSAY